MFRDQEPIPLNLPSVSGWKEIPIKEGGELLIPLGPFSPQNKIFTRSIYGGEGTESPYRKSPLIGGLISVFVREDVARDLSVAQDLLPNRMHLVVFDAYRPLEVQQSLFDKYYTDLKDFNPNFTEQELLEETQKYVSLPSTDKSKPSPHNTGGAVDLAIFSLPQDVDILVKEIDSQLENLPDNNWQLAYMLEMRKIALIRTNMKMLDFGTLFDWGGSEAALNHYEQISQSRNLTINEIVARNNRRLIYNVMGEAGFEPFESEWWHYNSKKSQMGAKSAGLPFAEYGAINLSPPNKEHEQMRKNHRLGSIRFHEGTNLLVTIKSTYYVVAEQAVRETGDIRASSLPIASIISPQ